MTQARGLKVALLATAAAIVMAVPALADTTIETVVVTAEKRSEEVKNVPMGLTVLNGDALKKLNDRSFEDYVNQVPGMSLTESNPTHPNLILRGINAGGDGSTVGVYIDDTPYGSSNALANGSILAPNIDTFDIARVEVLKGPQGTLYGANTLGGLLHFVSNQPSTSGFDDGIELSGMDYDNGGDGGSVRGMVNVPLGDNFALRASGFERYTPGYIDDPGRGLKNINGIHAYGGRVSLLVQPDQDLTIRFNILNETLSASNDNAEDVLLIGPKIVPKYGNYQEQRTTNVPTSSRYAIYNGTVDWNVDFATLTSSTSYGQVHDTLFQDGTGVFGLDVAGILRQGKFSQEIRLASNAPIEGFDWLAGAYYTNEDATLRQDLVPALHGPSLAFLRLDSRYIETAVFANFTYHFTPAFDVNLGGRYLHDQQHASQSGLATGFGRSSDGVFTWSAAAHYALDDDTSLYARIAKGFRPGGPNVLPFGPLPPGVPSFFNPDSLINYEVGAKGSALDGRLSYDADVYYIDWSDIQLLEVINNVAINGNGGGARSVGVEADVVWQPIDPLTLSFNGAYTNAELTEDTPAIVGGKKGDPLSWTPDWASTIDGDYRFDPLGDFTPYVGASWHYVGERPSDFQAGAPLRQYTMPAYNAIDARIGVDWQQWTLEFYGKNLTDEKGFTSFGAVGTSAASGNAASVAVMAPREIGILLRGKI